MSQCKWMDTDRITTQKMTVRHHWPSHSRWHQAWLLANWQHRWNAGSSQLLSEYLSIYQYFFSWNLKRWPHVTTYFPQVGQHRDVSPLPPRICRLRLQVRRNVRGSASLSCLALVSFAKTGPMSWTTSWPATPMVSTKVWQLATASYVLIDSDTNDMIH